MRNRNLKKMPRAVWGVFWTFLIISSGNYISQFMTLYLTTKLGLESSYVGTIVSLAGVASVPGIILGGKLNDIWGTKKSFTLFQTIAIVVTAVIILVEDRVVTPVMILLNSFAISAIYPICNATLFEVTEGEEKREGAVGIFMVAMYIGYMLSGLGCALGFSKYYKRLYVLEVAMKALSIFIFIFSVKIESNKKKVEKQVKPEEVLQENKKGLAYILFKNPVLLFFSISCCIFSIVYTQNAYSLPIQLNDKFGEMGSTYYGYVMMLNAFLIVAGTETTNKLMKGRNKLNVVLFATILVGGGMGILYCNLGLPLYIISTVLWSTAYMIDNPFATAYIGSYAPKDMLGRFSAWIKIVTGAGYALGPLFFGYVIKQTGIHSVWCYCILLTVLNVVILIGIKIRETLSSK